MDNIQKGALVAVSVGVVIVIVIVSLQWSASNSQSDECNRWSEELEDRLADINARGESLGGALDISGDLKSDRDQYNLDVDRYNLECAGEETNFYEENR